MLFFSLFPSLSIFLVPTVFPGSSHFPSTKCLSSVIWLSLRPQFSHTFLLHPSNFTLPAFTAECQPGSHCRLQGEGSQLPLQPNGETEGSEGEMMAGIGETGKQRNVEGKMGFLLVDAARKLGLAYLVDLHLQKTFHLYEQG